MARREIAVESLPPKLKYCVSGHVSGISVLAQTYTFVNI